MDTLKKYRLFIALFLLVIFAAVGYFNKPKTVVMRASIEPTPQQVEPVTVPLMVQDLEFAKPVIARFPAAKGKMKPNDDLAGFTKTPIAFFDNSYFLVEGVYATYTQVPNRKPIASIGGFFVYNSPVEKSFPVIYSPGRKAYGYFTGDIIVSGGYEKALEIIQSKAFDVIYKNEVSEQIIFKVEDLEDLSSLEDLKSNPQSEIEPDVKFSRLMPI